MNTVKRSVATSGSLKEGSAQTSKATPSAVQSVGVALAVVEELAYASDPIGVSELARRLGHTKARVHRHLLTLRDLGFVEKDAASDRYRLGWKLFRLGMAVGENFDLRRTAHQHLLRLHDRVAQTIVLVMPAGAQQVAVVDAVQSRADVAITVRPGSLMPAESSAMGRVILAFQPHGPEDPPANAKRLALIRQRWYEVAVDERLVGVGGLAAPIFDESNQIAAALGIVAVSNRLRDPPEPQMKNHLQQAAAAISAELRSTRWLEAGGAPGSSKRSAV